MVLSELDERVGVLSRGRALVLEEVVVRLVFLLTVDVVIGSICTPPCAAPQRGGPQNVADDFEPIVFVRVETRQPISHPQVLMWPVMERGRSVESRKTTDYRTCASNDVAPCIYPPGFTLDSCLMAEQHYGRSTSAEQKSTAGRQAVLARSMYHRQLL